MFINRLASRILTFLFLLLAASSARATITVLDYWHMGENDLGPVAGNYCSNIVDSVGGNNLTNADALNYFGVYTNGVSPSAAAETGSTVAVVFTNSEFATAALATTASDNFGIECWVNPGTNVSGGHILANNGARNNGWGLYLSGTNFQVIFGGSAFFNPVPATPNAWTHLALVRTNGISTFYTNGVAAGPTFANSPLPPTGTFTVGGDALFPDETFSGAIDEVRVFTVAAGAFSTNDLLFYSPNVLVYNTSDADAGSLRAALASAPSGATIRFSPALAGQSIVLTNGVLSLNNSVTIDASIFSNGIILDGQHISEIFSVQSGAAVTLNSLTIAKGFDEDTETGGVYNRGQLSLSNCIFVGNTSDFSGGAVLNDGSSGTPPDGTLIVNNCLFTNNFQMTGGFYGGGAIFNSSGTAMVTNSTFTGNTAIDIATGGGAIYNVGELTVSGCTFNANNANESHFGGGAICSLQGQLTLNNCTFAGNQASYNENGGGAVANFDSISINNCTFAGNQATDGASGGAVYSTTAITLQNTIIAGNVADIGSDVFSDASVDLQNCLTGPEADAINALSISTLVIGASANISGVNPRLAPLGNYGGPTQTMPPFANSPAIDSSMPTSLTTDQRGHPRVAGVKADIGAVEVDPNSIVTNNTDNGLLGSLRYAVANTYPGDLIDFTTNLSGATITLSGTQILLTNGVTIDGSSLPKGIQINGNHASRIFAMATNATATLTALTITNGVGTDPGYGGGIMNFSTNSTLTVNRCTVVGNSTDFSAGGLYNSGTTIINECTFTGNSTGSGGSGGGGIYNDGIMTLSQSTVSGNTSTSTTGASGLATYFGTLAMTNTIVAGNTSPSGVQFAYGTFTAANNLTSGNPMLAPLGNYGGPTQTMPPLPGSPAIDTGDAINAAAFTTDQRGYPRIADGAPDIGAVEGVYVATGPGIVSSTIGSGFFVVNFTNFTGANFPVATSTSLAVPTSNWTQIGYATESPTGSGQFQFTDLEALTNSIQRYYRVKSF
jgi:predicted outer membrane repeat protein